MCLWRFAGTFREDRSHLMYSKTPTFFQQSDAKYRLNCIVRFGDRDVSSNLKIGVHAYIAKTQAGKSLIEGINAAVRGSDFVLIE
jgi:hypothetical protein